MKLEDFYQLTKEEAEQAFNATNSFFTDSKQEYQSLQQDKTMYKDRLIKCGEVMDKLNNENKKLRELLDEGEPLIRKLKGYLSMDRYNNETLGDIERFLNQYAEAKNV